MWTEAESLISRRRRSSILVTASSVCEKVA
jgi:hypothetical protein